MIIESLVIENLFSYQGKVEFDLRPRSPDRPIVVIRARNGQGKTNLLNALKLGLGGLTDDLRAEAAAVGQSVTHNGYVWGAPHQRWEGIINRQARRRSVWDTHHGVTVGVRADADTILIRRSWTSDQTAARGAYVGTLDVKVNGVALDEREKAEDLLHQVMPADLLPYFLFDGELVQRMGAFAGDSIKRDAYKLMELHLIERLSEELASRAAEWVREAKTAEVHARVIGFENTIRRCEAEQLKVKETQASHSAGQRKLEEQLREVERKLRQFDDTGHEDRARLAAQVDSAWGRVEGLRKEVFERLLPLSPLRFNEPLNQAVREQVERSQRSGLAVDSYYDTRMAIKRVPTKIAEDPELAYLPSAARSRVLEVSERHLAGVLPPPPPPVEGAWLGLSAAHAAGVLQTLNDWGGRASAQDARAQLRDLATAHAEAEALQVRLDNTADLSAAQKDERARLQGELGQLNRALERIKVELELCAKELLQLGQERGRAQGELDQALAERARREGAQSRAGLAQRAADFTQDLLRAAAEHRRARLNLLINQRFAGIFSSSAQIGQLKIDEDMRLRLFTPDGRVIEPYNLSAGMRQLVAVALLWALQGISRREMPVAIDTPIARLDREHQERVLFTYLPQASRQVILLPTDAELDDTRLRALAPHISHGYTLINRSGEATVRQDLPIPGVSP